MSNRQLKLQMELRRGVLVLAVLATLRHEHYGYSLRQQLIAGGVDIEEGTLYPLVRRLESQGLLTSEWREGDGRRKRFYRISAEGEELFVALRREWSSLTDSLRGILEEDNS